MCVLQRLERKMPQDKLGLLFRESAAYGYQVLAPKKKGDQLVGFLPG
jgi:hypothetical protein